MTIKTQAQLIEAAKNAGATVTEVDGGHVDIKRDQRAIRIWADRVIHRRNVGCAQQARINVQAAAAFLKLPA
jgi:hypothetical protein